MAILPWSSATLFVAGTDIASVNGFRWVDKDGLFTRGGFRRDVEPLPGQQGEQAEDGVRDAFDFTVVGAIDPLNGSGVYQGDAAGWAWLWANLLDLYDVVASADVVTLKRRLPSTSATTSYVDYTATGYLQSVTLQRPSEGAEGASVTATSDIPVREVTMVFRNADGAWTQV